MNLKDYFSNIKKKYSEYSFSNIAFDSSKVKKYIFLLLKEIILMDMILLQSYKKWFKNNSS